MRWMVLCLSLWAMMGILTSPLAGGQPIWPDSSPPYCRTGELPAGFPLAPCCGEPHLPCADNAWDGYCQHKARWQAFWYRFGTRAPACAPVQSR